VTFTFERLEQEGGARRAIISMAGSQQGGLTGSVTGELTVDLVAGRLEHMVTNMMVQTEARGPLTRARITTETVP